MAHRVGNRRVVVTRPQVHKAALPIPLLAGVLEGVGARALGLDGHPELVGPVRLRDDSRGVGNRPDRAEAVGVVDSVCRLNR
jgi:hypothetical protein